MSESDGNTVLYECFTYNDELRKNGHFVANLQDIRRIYCEAKMTLCCVTKGWLFRAFARM